MLTLCGLHGLFGRPDHWAPLHAALGARHRLLAPALPLTLAAARDGIPGLSRFVADWLAARDARRVVLLGNSFGGHVALDLALRCSARVAGLVLTGSAGLVERTFTRGVPASPSAAFVRARLGEVFYEPTLVTDARVAEVHGFLRDRANVRAMLAWARATRDYPMGPHLPRIAAPALLVWGEEDRITPLAAARAFEAGLPAARLVTIARCGHAPMLEAPELVAALVAPFLDALAGPAAARAVAALA